MAGERKKLAREGGSPPFPIYVLFLCFLIFQLATNFDVLNGRRSPLLPSVSYFTFCFYVRVQFNLFYNIRQGGGIHPRAVSPVIIPAPPPPTLHFILLVLYLFGLEHRIVLHSDPQVLQRSNDPRLVYHIPGHFVHELLKVDLVIEDFFDPAFSFFEFLVFHGKLFRSYQPSDTPNKVAQYVPFCAAGQSEVSGVLQLPNG